MLRLFSQPLHHSTFFFSITHSFIHSSLRTSTRQTTQTAPQPAASSSNTTRRVSSRGTSSTCRSTTRWLFSGVSTSSSPWASARWQGPSPPTTGPSTNPATSPTFLCLLASYALSGGLMSCCHMVTSSYSRCVHPCQKRPK